MTIPNVIPAGHGFSELHYRDLTGPDGRPKIQLTRPLIYSSGINGSGLRIVVPVGTISDKGSTPWWLWCLFPPHGHAPEYILHDYLYGLTDDVVSRFLADAILRETMHRRGTKLWRRLVIYYGVRIFGRRRKT